MAPLDDERLGELRRRGDTLFRSAYNERPVRVSSELADRRLRVLREDSAAAPAPDADRLEDATFSGFDVAHQGTALALARRLSGIAGQQPDEDGLGAVLDAATQELEMQNSDLVKYALAVFVTNHPLGRNLYIPPLVAESPEMFIPSHPETSPAVAALGGLGDEAMLDYFREDPDFNTHHSQWHRVYPFGGVPDPEDPDGPPVVKDRQGELFWYMHQQMLARYDTERAALELPPAVAFGDYQAEAEGYAVEPLLANRFDGRDAGLRIADVRFGLPPAGVLDVSDLEAIRKLFRDAARDGEFHVDGQAVALTPDVAGADLLGATLEASIAAADLGGDVAAVGGLHNIGHGFFSALSGDRGGVMQTPAAAVRDPIFHRWHRHIDDLFVTWQENLPENDLAAGAPPVVVRKGSDGNSDDIALALLRDLAPGTADGTRFDGAGFGASAFGGAHWDTPLAQCPDGVGRLTGTLESTIGRYPLRMPNGDTFTIFHLDHEEFAYFLRLENPTDTTAQVTVRVFLVAAEHVDDRRWWIEMDKFVEHLAAGERSVVYRPARLSSVVRKRARRPLEPAPGPQDANDDYCNCGWPYHMLLPRGREDGMAFRLMVLLTGAEQDLSGTDLECGSVSFCGSRDARYPDSRMMGYPFDRPFRSRTIGETIADPALTHLAGLDLTIVHRPTE